jgi:anti-anti-sigma regulatory factor/putative methionine-R-sulfoxide reductase with GAF domain
LTGARSLNELAALAVAEVRQIRDAEYICFYLQDPGGERLRMFAQHGFTPEEQEEAERTAHERHPGQVVRTRRVLHVADVQSDPQASLSDRKRRHEIRSRLFLPIESEGQCIGTMGMGSVHPHHFSPHQVALLGVLCHLIGVMHRNLWRLEALEQRVAEVRRQQQELEDLSAPIAELGKGVLVVPIIGWMTPERVDRLTEKLLVGARERRARAVLLDLTGLAGEDGGALPLLTRIGASLRLLGVRCLLCGLSPRLAWRAAEQQVELGVVFSSLGQALQAAQGLTS